MTTDTLFDVSREIVLITGVAGQLGREYANAFLARGACVVGLDIRPPAASDNLATDYPATYIFCSADVTSKISLLHALAEITTKFGTPTVLVNNAAIDSPPSAPLEENGPFEDYPEASWDKVIDVNLKGVYLCCQVFGSSMAKANKGSIINISSIYGVLSPDQNIYKYRRDRGEVFFKPVAYAASKAGILNLTRYLAVYWAKQGCADPVALLKKYPNRFLLMHLKDREHGTQCNDTGRADEETNVVLGKGDVNIKAIMKAAKKTAVKHYFIEDESTRVMTQLPLSLQFLKSLR
jgi:NAD(P)-dependent dehydrogenase (short-subunit alcohol dehydrogenase family)